MFCQSDRWEMAFQYSFNLPFSYFWVRLEKLFIYLRSICISFSVKLFASHLILLQVRRPLVLYFWKFGDINCKYAFNFVMYIYFVYGGFFFFFLPCKSEYINLFPYYFWMLIHSLEYFLSFQVINGHIHFKTCICMFSFLSFTSLIKLEFFLAYCDYFPYGSPFISMLLFRRPSLPTDLRSHLYCTLYLHMQLACLDFSIQLHWFIWLLMYQYQNVLIIEAL